MSDRYKHIDSGEVVKIMDNNGKFYTLNNGMKIDKQLFTNKYSILNDGGFTGNKNEINAEDFLNQKTNIQMKVPKTPNVIQQTQPTTNESVNSVDPDNFFNSSNIPFEGVDGLKNLDTSKLIDVPLSQKTQIIDRTDETISPTQNLSLEEEKKRVLEKYSTTQQPQQPTQGIGTKMIDEDNPEELELMLNSKKPERPELVVNENGLTEYQESFRQQQIELNGSDPYADKVAKYQEEQRKTNIYKVPETKEPLSEPIQTTQPQPQSRPEPNDPVYSFFKSAKKIHEMKIKLNINTKIGKPEFIKMMSENLEGDFIKYYAEDILKDLLSDVVKIEKTIYDQVYKEIYGEEKPKKRIIPKVPKEERSQLNEGVDEVIVLIPGKKTKTNKQTFKFINNKGKVVDMLPKTAEQKNFKPATKKDL